MAGPVTLKDIARETGVHVSTVSRALDLNARHSISAEVVDRITKAAARMGYRPNRMATGLRTRRTMTVGVILPDIANTLFPPMVRGIESVIEPLGYALIIVNTDNDPHRARRLLDAVLDHGVDGLIDVAPTRDDPAIDEVVARGLPVVAANRRMDNGSVPAVISDETAGIVAALRHLYDAGHRRIAHIAGPESLSTGVERRKAFEASAKALGIAVPPNAVVAAERYHEADGRRAAERLLDGDGEFTAFLCANDGLALGAIDALRARGLDCPRDVSVTGFNDIPLLDHIAPGLTTVRIHKHEVGRKAAELLVRMMTDPEAEVEPLTVLPVELIQRASVGPPRAGLHSAAE